MSLFNLIKLVMTLLLWKRNQHQKIGSIVPGEVHSHGSVTFGVLGVISDDYLDRLLQNSRLLDQLALFSVSRLWLPSMIQIELECFGLVQVSSVH